jgi:hypothetical protein
MTKAFLLTFIMGLATIGYSQSEEEQAIKQLLEKESSTWRSGDIKGHASCWSIQPYSRILSSTGDGTVFDIPPEVMINPPANIFGKGGTSRNTNYKMNISGNNAWVCHDEESTAIDGKKTLTTEFRILEKINGSWKLVAQSIHARKP